MQQSMGAIRASLADPALRVMFEARKRVFVDLLKVVDRTRRPRREEILLQSRDEEIEVREAERVVHCARTLRG